MTPGTVRIQCRRCLPLALLLASLLSAPGGIGCARQHTIEPGTWRLAFRGNPGSEKYVPPPADVEVLLDWGAEEGVEEVTVKLSPPGDPEAAARPYVLKGQLAEGRIELSGSTRFWLIQLWGEVQSPFIMAGNAYARGRLDDSLYFDGRWKMSKVRPPEAGAE